MLIVQSHSLFADTKRNIRAWAHLNRTLLAGRVDAEDGARGDAGVDVGRAVQRVKDHHIVACAFESTPSTLNPKP